MTRPNDDQLLAFLEGRLAEPDRSALLEQLTRDPRLAAELRQAAAGLAAIEPLGAIPTATPAPAPGGWRISPWWAVAAAAAAVVLTVPATRLLSAPEPGSERPAPQGTMAVVPEPEPGYVMVLLGRWPDAATVDPAERQRRANEYWAWTDSLAGAATLMAAGDLRWEPGSRLGPEGRPVAVPASAVESPDFVVGMFAIRADSDEEALAIASACPHLRYGGSVSIRHSARGFLTAQAPTAPPTTGP